MVNKSIEEQKQPVKDKETADEPGRTPGQAEGEDEAAAPYDPARDPGRTPGQAEGDRETVEAHGLDEETPPALSQRKDVSTPHQQATFRLSSPVRVQSPAKHRRWQHSSSSTQLLRWSALFSGGWLALTGVRHSLGSLINIGLGALLIYYGLQGKWPATKRTRWQAEPSVKDATQRY